MAIKYDKQAFLLLTRIFFSFRDHILFNKYLIAPATKSDPAG